MAILKINKLYNEDCLECMRRIDDKSVDMICTDLPFETTSRNKWDSLIPFDDYVIFRGKIAYWKEFLILALYNFDWSYKTASEYWNENKKDGLWNQYKRIIKDNGAIVLFGSGMFTADLMQSNRDMWKYNLIWQKTQPTGHLNAKKMPLRSHEDICVFYKKLSTYNPQKTTGHPRKVSKTEHKTNCKQSLDYGESGLTTYDSTERYPKSVWTFSKDTQKSALHSAQKPVALIGELIKTYTNEGELVLDSCAGSCTTAIAALNTGRNYICIEKDKEIFEVGKNRVDGYLKRKEEKNL